MNPTSAIPWLVFSWGLAGGFTHCIGMCGVFVASYSGLAAQGSTRRFLHPERHVLFHGGRMLSLVALGTIGGLVADITHRWSFAQGAISLGAGVLLIGLALGFAGIIPWLRIPEPDILGAGGGFGRKLFVRVLKSQNVWKPLMIGVFVGLLPCGLTYQALLLGALSRGPAQGALTMALFCLGTIPGLLTLGLFGGAVFGGLLTRPGFRLGMARISALLMAAMGVAFLLRGWSQF